MRPSVADQLISRAKPRLLILPLLATSLFSGVFSACAPSARNKITPPISTTSQASLPKASAPHEPVLKRAPQIAPQKILPLRYHRTSRSAITLSLVAFDDRQYQLKVADQKNGPGTHWNDSKSAAQAHQGVAAINGGFFTPNGKPLGLVVTNGERRGHLNHSSLGAGMFLVGSERSAIVRRASYTQLIQTYGQINQLLQTGPMLVERSQAVPGLSQANRRPRSLIVWDGQHHWAIAYTSPCTLHELAKAIAGRAPAEFPIQTAINLDGGRSSDLWVGTQVSDGNHTHRSFLNKAVRNFLVVVPN